MKDVSKNVKQRLAGFLISTALVIFAMAAGAACYHQYLIQRGMLRTGPQSVQGTYYEK